MLFVIWYTLCAVVVAAPTSSKHFVEPRNDGLADIPRFIHALSATQARYARLAESKRDVSDYLLSNSTTALVTSDYVKTAKRADVNPRPNLEPPLPPIHVSLVEYEALHTQPGKEYVAQTSVQHQERDPFLTRFDTMEGDYMVPSVSCTEQRGCSGAAHEKYQEGGQYIPDRRDAQNKQHYDLAQFAQFFDSVSLDEITASQFLMLSVRLTTDWPHIEVNEPYALAVMGLGGDGTNSVDWFQAVCRDTALGNRPWEFSFFFGRTITGTADRHQLTFGGRNPSLYNTPPIEIPTSMPARNAFLWRKFSWEVSLQGYTHGPDTLPTDDMTRSAVFDSTASFIILTVPDADALWATVRGSVPLYQRSDLLPPPGQPIPGQGLRLVHHAVRGYAYPCRERPVFEFHLGHNGTPFAVNFMDINAGMIEEHEDGAALVDEPFSTRFRDALRGPEPMCLSTVVGIRTNSVAEQAGLPRRTYLGIPFMKSWYTTFKRSRDRSSVDTISLARAIGDLLPGNNPDNFGPPVQVQNPWPDADSSETDTWSSAESQGTIETE